MIKEIKNLKPQMDTLSRFTQNIPLISESYTLTNTYDLKFYNQWLR